jgi:hypothetical protein
VPLATIVMEACHEASTRPASLGRPRLRGDRRVTRSGGSVGDSNPCRAQSCARRPPAASDPSHGQRARTSACPSSCVLRRGRRVTKTVTKQRDSPASCGITASHRVTGNPSILLTGPHGTARHSQLPKLDVAGSIPVARSTTPVHPGTRRASQYSPRPRRSTSTPGPVLIYSAAGSRPAHGSGLSVATYRSRENSSTVRPACRMRLRRVPLASSR